MKKIALLILLVGALFAENKSDYIGLGGGLTKFSTTTGNNDGTHGSLILGHKYGESGRLSLSYSYVDSASTINKSSVTLLSYDYIVPMFDNIFAVYFGPSLGYTSLSNSSVDLSGASYGGQVGCLLNLSDGYDIDLGAKYLGVDSDYLDSDTIFYLNFDIHFNAQELFDL